MQHTRDDGLLATDAHSKALACYASIWTLYTWVPALDAALSGAQGAVDSRPLTHGDLLLLPLALLACWRCVSPRTLAAAHLVKLALFFMRLPFVWDHEWWATLNEAALVGACLLSPLEPAPAFFEAARVQLVLLYASAAFWKLNTSFLDPTTSCATVILMQQLAAFAPPALASTAAAAVAACAPTLAIAVELLIPALLYFRPRAGVALALLFHGLVLLTPAPNYAGGFSVSCAARLLLCLPPTRAAHVQLLAVGPALAASLAAAATAEPSATLTAFAAIGTAHLVALVPRDAPATAPPPPARLSHGERRSLTSGAAWATALYAVALPVLGLQHMGSSSMYANLKHWGGSNHLLVPTGLLQDWLADAGGALGSAFGGGLVRVDRVRGLSLEALNCWASLEPVPRVAHLLRASGHSGRQLAAYYSPGRMASLDAAGHAVAAPALPVAMPAFELRRALAAARAQHLEAEATAVRLPHALRTPAEWLAHRGSAVTIGADGSCVRARSGPLRWVEARRCNADELRLATPPPWLLAKLLLPYPAPLLPGDSTELHCSA